MNLLLTEGRASDTLLSQSFDVDLFNKKHKGDREKEIVPEQKQALLARITRVINEQLSQTLEPRTCANSYQSPSFEWAFTL